MMLSKDSQQELLLWIHNNQISKTTPLSLRQLRRNKGEGVMNSLKISGRCTQGETFLLIKILELGAVQFALLTLVRDLINRNIQLQIDNKSAVAYINHMGGTHLKILKFGNGQFRETFT